MTLAAVCTAGRALTPALLVWVQGSFYPRAALYCFTIYVPSSRSKCFLALWMLTTVAADAKKKQRNMRSVGIGTSRVRE